MFGHASAAHEEARRISSLANGTFSYDGDGDLTAVAGTGLPSGTFTWEDRGLLTSASAGGQTVSYGYNAGGQRVWSQVGSNPKTFYLFAGSTLIGEIQNGVPSVAYTWGANGLVSERLLATNRSLWYAFGPQGETRQLTDSTGTVADTYLYSPYGVLLASTGSDVNPFQYGGQAGYYADANNLTGIVLCGLRWYSPTLGRWLSRDPIGYAGGANLYEYCDSNPVGPLDPMGLEPPHADEEAESYNLDDCGDLMRYINALLQRLGQRYQDMRLDPHDLYRLERTRGVVHPEHGSWSGHRQRYRDLQRNLRDAWKRFQK